MRSLAFALPFALVASLAACSSDSSSSSGGSSSGGTTSATFRKDVMPILTQSCALSSCHGSSGSNLGIYLSYDATQVHAELLKESPTAKGYKFVVPGDPAKSYLQMKIDGTQAQAASACGGCGAPMPLDLPALSQAKRDTIRAWIQAGAKDD